MVFIEEVSEAELVLAVGTGDKRCLLAVPTVTLNMPSLAGKANIVDIRERRGIEDAEATRVPAVLHHFSKSRSAQLIVDERDKLDYVVPFGHVDLDFFQGHSIIHRFQKILQLSVEVLVKGLELVRGVLRNNDSLHVLLRGLQVRVNSGIVLTGPAVRKE